MNKAELSMAKPRLKVKPAELAVMLGVSRQAVAKALRDPAAPPLDADGKIEAEKALAWYATRGARGAKAVAQYRDAMFRGDVTGGKGAGRSGKAPEVPPIVESRKRQAWAQAQLAEIELSRERGLLVPREEVERLGARDGATVRDALLALPSEIAPALADAAMAGGAAAVAELLDSHVRRLLSAWAHTWQVMRCEGEAADD